MKKEEYKLEEVLKSFYKVEPLKTDLAKNVSDKIFQKQGSRFSSVDNWMYVFAALLILIGLMYSLSFVNYFSIPSICMIVFLITCFVGLARKEYMMFSKRLLSMS